MLCHSLSTNFSILYSGKFLSIPTYKSFKKTNELSILVSIHDMAQPFILPQAEIVLVFPARKCFSASDCRLCWKNSISCRFRPFLSQASSLSFCLVFGAPSGALAIGDDSWTPQWPHTSKNVKCGGLRLQRFDCAIRQLNSSQCRTNPMQEI